jgi:hypothetical protein
MTLRAHYELVCDGGFTEGCVKSAACAGSLDLGVGKVDVRGAARAAGWRWVVDVRGDVQLCGACIEVNRARYEVTKGTKSFCPQMDTDERG